MENWVIVLIVVLIFIFVFIPTLIFTTAGFMTVKMCKKGDRRAINPKIMDISFYERGPMKKLGREGFEYLKTLDKEDVFIESYDGLKLHAVIFKNPILNTNKYFLGMHGFKSLNTYEFGLYAKKYFEMGFNLILPDERAHHESQGKYLTMGGKEKYDVLSWANYIVNNFGDDVSILVQGISMGAATVCLASELDLPKQVIGIISDCAYSSITDEIKFVIQKQAKIPMFPLINIIGIYLRVFTGASLKKINPKEAVKNAKVPMLFFHGRKDEMVPCKFSEQIYENCGSRKKLVICEEANHAETRAFLGNEYFETIKEFFNL